MRLPFSLIILFFFASAVTNALAEDRGNFPYVFSEEPIQKPYHRVRPEGRVHEMDLWEKIGYLQKYLVSKKFTTSVEERNYFDHQRTLWSFLHSQPVPEHTTSAKLGFVGDIMWIRDNWTNFLSPEVRNYMLGFDGFVGNLETVISEHHRVPSLLPDQVNFNSPPALLTSFRRDNGRNLFTALSVANNHSLDYDDAGALDTIRFLDTQDIAHSGVRKSAEEKLYTVFTLNGIKVGFYAATFGLNDSEKLENTKIKLNVLAGITPEHPNQKVELTEIRSVLKQMKTAGVDFRIISLHWGHEFEYYPSPIEMQTAREIVRSGADMILGSHPHAQQPDEICFVNGYEKKFSPSDQATIKALNDPSGCILSDGEQAQRKAYITYSMGNFTTAMFTFLCKVGVIKDITLFKKANGQVDWAVPNMKLIYNLSANADGQRKLVLLDNFLKAKCFEPPAHCRAFSSSQDAGVVASECNPQSGCAEDLLQEVDFLRSHLSDVDYSSQRKPDSVGRPPQKSSIKKQQSLLRKSES